MKVISVEDAIKNTFCDHVRSQFPQAPYPAYDYQCAAYRITSEAIRHAKFEPSVIVASVSAGKTDMISMITARIQQMNAAQVAAGKEPYQCMVISRQAEIVDQDAEKMWAYNVQNSIFCAGLSRKSVAFPVIAASEGTAVNALTDSIRPEGRLRVSFSKPCFAKAPASASAMFARIRKHTKKGALSNFAPFFMLIDECHMVSVDDYCESEENGESLKQMRREKRSSYTQIIRTMQKRCMEKYGKKLRIIGYTGSPWRDNRSIINENMKTPGLWRKTLINIDTTYLQSVGAVVPYTFGRTGDLGYDLSKFHATGDDGISDFSEADLKAMEKEIQSQGTMTQKIMLDVQRLAADRNCVLVTCAGKKHCQEAAEALLPGTSYIIITDDMGQKERLAAVEKIKRGEYKYTFQIGCLTTGVNVPMWDVGVILRRIGSITLVTQLNGRIIRLLDNRKYPDSVIKNDALILDYSGTMDDLAGVFMDPQLEAYQYFKAEEDDEWQVCPECDQQNSIHARRCIGRDYSGERCEHFFKFRICDDAFDNSTGKLVKVGCGIKNDPCARFCRACSETLIDPNEKLSGTHYKDGDYSDVLKMEVKLTKDQLAIVLAYTLRNQDGDVYRASELFMPESEHVWAKNVFRAEIIGKHVENNEIRKQMRGISNAVRLMKFSSFIRKPTRVTHRKNGKGKDIISNKEFSNGGF